MNTKKTNKGSKGGLLEGPSHDNGGIPVVVKSTGEPIEVEGGEIIINKKASELHCEELSKINQSAGNGIAIPCESPSWNNKTAKQGAKISSLTCENCGWGWEPETSEPEDWHICHKCNHENKFSHGGLPLTKERQEIYSKWSSLVNMTESDLEKFYNSPLGKTAGLTEAQAKANKIHSGRESARWLLKMIPLDPKEWTPLMWSWANRQISFISRMSGVKGPLYDNNGEPTRKLLALLIWGHNPEKKNTGGKLFMNEFKEGGKPKEKLFTNNAIFISKIIELEQNYVPTEEKLIDANTPNISAFRNSLVDWIKDTKNDVKVIIAFSGGKDSVAMVLHAVYELKIPTSQIELWHHEVDGMGEKVFDWQCTPSYCKAFADHFKIPILFSYRKNGIIGEVTKNNTTSQNIYFQSEAGGKYKEWTAKEGTQSEPTKWVNTRNMFPATSANLGSRWCSAKVKIEVMARTITNDERFDKGNFVIMTGERREESPNRSGYAEIEPYANMTKNRTALSWRPIIDMLEKDIWDLMEKHKIQPHPCYELGWGRCSCQLCIFNDADTWATIRETSPEKVQRISELEKQNKERGSKQPYLKSYKPKKNEIQTPQTSMFGETAEFTESGNQGIPINQWIDKNKGKSYYNPQTDGFWLKQALGEFTSPIINEKWTLPKGAFSKKQNGAN